MKHRANGSSVLAALIVFALVGGGYAVTTVSAAKTSAQQTEVAPTATKSQKTPKTPTVMLPTTSVL